MSEADREHWDVRYSDLGVAPTTPPGVPPPEFGSVQDILPTSGHALELACGRGRGAVWLAGHGLSYWGVDVSPVAITNARQLIQQYEFADRCRFDVVDLDGGLPEGRPVDLVLCYWFHKSRLDRAIIDRLKPGGLLAITVQSEVGVGAGPHRAPPGVLMASFGELEIVDQGEANGTAWLVGRRSGKGRPTLGPSGTV